MIAVSLSSGDTLWFNGEKWTVHSVVSPNKYDDFILVFQRLEDESHSDGTTPVVMACIDAHNDVFNSDTPQAKSLSDELSALRYKVDAVKRRLCDLWVEEVSGD